jgi:hypothetical protein
VLREQRLHLEQQECPGKDCQRKNGHHMQSANHTPGTASGKFRSKKDPSAGQISSNAQFCRINAVFRKVSHALTKAIVSTLLLAVPSLEHMPDEEYFD